ncbi:DUF2066 domain-containing protein [Pseudoalteromonas sp. T1lg65]|uniref:DUF2066 domain-containing protein n=1 Tax=Pseudoalteromonas sp. T1lg65 TaxID=2077101 RepID=UPI003F7B311E
MIQRLLIILVLLLPVSSNAVEVHDLYEATLSVDDKSRKTRLEASQAALLTVLQKLTGRADNYKHPAIKESMRRISDLMLKYEYFEQGGQDKIRVRFESTKVEQLVREANLPLWGNRRPLVAIWLVIEDNLRREFVTQESYPQLERLIYDTAAEWGVPVVVPLMDLTDRANVSIAEVWGNFSTQVEQASTRYDAEKVITARLFKQPYSSKWQLDWRYTDAELFEPEQLVGDQQQVLISMINTMSSGLASQYVIDPNRSNSIRTSIVTVDNLHDFKSIEMAKRRLQTMSTVSDVDVLYRAKGQVRFSIEHASSVRDLQKSIGLEQSFKVYIDPRAFYQVADLNNLKYTWIGQ